MLPFHNWKISATRVLTALLPALLAFQGHAETLTLEASKKIGSEKTFNQAFAFQIPDSIDVKQGQAGSHKVEFSFGNPSRDSMATCTFKGSEKPAKKGQVNAFYFFNCKDNAKPGDKKSARHFKLELKSGNDIVAKLVLNLESAGAGGGLPPDPGEAGRLTLEGIDFDGDGVRDDLQRWIAQRFPDSEKKRSALRQWVIDFQASLVVADDKALSIQASRKFLASDECAMFVLDPNISNVQNLDSFTAAKNVLDSLRAVALNTLERTRAKFKVSRNFSGQTYKLLPRGQERNACRFNLDGMEN